MRGDDQHAKVLEPSLTQPIPSLIFYWMSHNALLHISITDAAIQLCKFFLRILIFLRWNKSAIIATDKLDLNLLVEPELDAYLDRLQVLSGS